MKPGTRIGWILGILVLSSCATVRTNGPGNGLSADSQAVAAKSIDEGIGAVRSLIRGKTVSLAAFPARQGTGERAPVQYLIGYMREILASEGSGYAGVDGGEVRIEIHAVTPGQAATQRNLIVPVQQNVRIPLFYSEGMRGETTIALIVRNERRESVPYTLDSGGTEDTEVFLFQVLGPFRP